MLGSVLAFFVTGVASASALRFLGAGVASCSLSSSDEDPSDVPDEVPSLAESPLADSSSSDEAL